MARFAYPAPSPDASPGSPRLRRLLRETAPWRFILWIVGPLAFIAVQLKLVRIRRHVGEFDILLVADLLRSDITFYLGAAALMGAAFAFAGGRRGRLTVALVAATAGVIAAVTETIVHNYFMATGDPGLNYAMMLLGLQQLHELGPALASEISLLSVATLAVLALCPLWALGTRPWNHRSPAAPRLRTRMATALCAIAALSFAVAIYPSPLHQEKLFSRGATLNAAVTTLQLLVEPRTAAAHQLYSGMPPDFGPPARLAPTASEHRGRMVIVILESVRARSVSIYNPKLPTTPFLVQLAENSLVAERAYTVVPHTSKAIYAALCGIMPRLRPPITEAIPGAVPVRCLADLLREQGYGTAFFQSATEDFENRRNLVANFGFESFFPLESMDAEPFERANYLGYEDDVMLKRSEAWLRQRGKDPFLAVYLTVTPHHDYLAPRRYGRLAFAENDDLNHYLNAVRYLDHFVANLIEQYKRLGLYEGTTFIIFGDHGEAFGEHGLLQHNDVPYEEVLHIPLLIHNPSLFPEGRRMDRLVNLLDIVPTVTDILGFSIAAGHYPGSSILSAPESRTLRAHCWNEQRCMASIRENLKFIHHFDRRPDEVFDLSRSPDERLPLTKLPQATLDRLRQDLVTWRARINAAYDSYFRRHLIGDES